MTVGYHLPEEHGDTWWFLDTRMTVKVGGDATQGAFTVIDFAAPEGFAPPLHVHEQEDEAFYVLEGEAEVLCGEERWRAEPGSFVFLPRGVAHSFHVSGGSLKALQLTTPAGFEAFVAELGRRPDRPRPPRALPAGRRPSRRGLGPPRLPDPRTVAAGPSHHGPHRRRRRSRNVGRLDSERRALSTAGSTKGGRRWKSASIFTL
ncbi:MAG: cupin domain-containing protein [Actinomycetota bacterium]|nr:cupin domain-containing protein [Actinomycetota bacterium]